MDENRYESLEESSAADRRRWYGDVARYRRAHVWRSLGAIGFSALMLVIFLHAKFPPVYQLIFQIGLGLAILGNLYLLLVLLSRSGGEVLLAQIAGRDRQVERKLDGNRIRSRATYWLEVTVRQQARLTRAGIADCSPGPNRWLRCTGENFQTLADDREGIFILYADALVGTHGFPAPPPAPPVIRLLTGCVTMITYLFLAVAMVGLALLALFALHH